MKNFYKRSMLIIMFLLAMAFLVLLAMGQAKAATPSTPTYFYQQEITGTVTNTNGEPLLGVTVIVKNKEYGTTTNSSGIFNINANNKDTLVFSFIGFKTKEMPLNGRNIVDITLEDDIASLNEVEINAGYYNTTERERTGNISRVTAEEIEQQPVLNPLAAIQGRMPGVQVTQNTGVPGGGFDLQIRGINSIRDNGNEPLYIIDGVPYASQSLGNRSVSTVLGGFNNPLNNINPQHIESIEILKDADATAIYGSRGANGVVLITTKKGKTAKSAFDVSASSGIGEVTRKSELMNTDQYLEMRREAYSNDGIDEYPANAYDVNGTWGQDRDTDWQEKLIGGTAKMSNIQASFTGGSALTSFLISGGHQKQTTVFPGDYAFRKSSILTNLNHSSENKRLNISFSANYVVDKNNQAGTDLTRESQNLPPNAPVLYTEEGELNWENSTWNNPLRYLETGYDAQNKSLIANSVLSYKLIDGLSIKANLGYTTASLKESKTTLNTYYKPAFGLGPEFSSVYLNEGERTSWIIEPQLTWSKEINDHEFNVLIGSTFQQQEEGGSSIFANGFTSNNLINDLTSANSVFIISTNSSIYKYAAAFGRINYQYLNRYIINLTGRRDGSSRFGSGRKFANFGAIGAAWIFSEEDLFQENTVLSFGKLRGSYGTTGNDQIGDYQYLSTYASTGSSYDNINTLEPTRLFNPQYAWETNEKLDLGLTLGFIEDRLMFEATYFRNISSNQLVGIPLPATTGFNSVLANLPATVENTGWEFILRTVNWNKQNFQWISALNLSVLNNELVSFPELESSTYANRYRIREPLSIRQLYDYTGVDPSTGLYTFTDFNEDGQLNRPDDTQTIVDTSPEFFGGLSNEIRFGNWNLNFLFQFVKQKGFDSTFFGPLPGAMVNQPVSLLDRWQAPGDQSIFQRYTTGINRDAVRAYSQYTGSDGGYTDASFIRLKNLYLSYQIPDNWLKNLDVSLYLQGQNLLTFTNYKGLDPENQSISSLPPLRIVSTGLQISIK